MSYVYFGEGLDGQNKEGTEDDGGWHEQRAELGAEPTVALHRVP